MGVILAFPGEEAGPVELLWTDPVASHTTPQVLSGS